MSLFMGIKQLIRRFLGSFFFGINASSDSGFVSGNNLANCAYASSGVIFVGIFGLPKWILSESNGSLFNGFFDYVIKILIFTS